MAYSQFGRGRGGSGTPRFCVNCGGNFAPGHAQICPATKQSEPPAYAVSSGGNNANVNDLAGQLRSLRSQFDSLNNQLTMMRVGPRLSELENRPTRASVPGLASMRVRHPLAPALTENRVFAFQLGALTSAPTTSWVESRRLTVDRNMEGFADWARGFSRISISSVCVKYTRNFVGGMGGAVGLAGFSPDSDISPNGLQTLLMTNHRVWNYADDMEFYYEFPVNSPFRRVIHGSTPEGDDRPLIRVHFFRSARQFIGPTANLPNVDLGFAHLYVQCACVRAPVS